MLRNYIESDSSNFESGIASTPCSIVVKTVIKKRIDVYGTETVVTEYTHANGSKSIQRGEPRPAVIASVAVDEVENVDSSSKAVHENASTQEESKIEVPPITDASYSRPLDPKKSKSKSITTRDTVTVMVVKPSQDTKAGISFVDSPRGPVLSRIDENGLFASSHLKVGDRIVSINDVDCFDGDSTLAAQLIRSSRDTVSLEVEQNHDNNDQQYLNDENPSQSEQEATVSPPVSEQGCWAARTYNEKFCIILSCIFAFILVVVVPIVVSRSGGDDDSSGSSGCEYEYAYCYGPYCYDNQGYTRNCYRYKLSYCGVC